MTPVRLLVVNPSPIRGGAEALLEELAWHADPARLVVTVACLSPGPFPASLEAGGARVVSIDAQRLRNPLAYARTVRRLARLAREHDAVLGWQVKGNYYATPAARLARRPCAWWDHGIRPGRGESRYFVDNRLPAVFRADRTIVSSQAAARSHRAATVIYPGVRLDAIRSGPQARSEARALLDLGDGPLVGVVGRLQPWKGQHLLIEAAPSILDTRPDARFVVVGDALGGFSAGYPGELRALAERLGVADRVHVLGHRDDVVKLLPAFDVATTPSFDEPFGIVTIEAMAAGVPVVGTASGGTPEILSDGAGLLVPPGDSLALGRAIAGLLADPGRAASIGDAGRRRARETFSIDRFLEECMTTVEQLAGRR